MAIISPHGGSLVNKVLPLTEYRRLIDGMHSFKRLDVDYYRFFEIRNIATGVYSPLKGYMNKDDLMSVVENETLVNGTPWAFPFVLPLVPGYSGNSGQPNPVDNKDPNLSGKFEPGDEVLFFYNNELIGMIKVDSVFELDAGTFINKLFDKKDSISNCDFRMLSDNKWFISGEVSLLKEEIDLTSSYFMSPKDIRARIRKRDWKNTAAVQISEFKGDGEIDRIEKMDNELDGLLLQLMTKEDQLETGAVSADFNKLEEYAESKAGLVSQVVVPSGYKHSRKFTQDAIIAKNFGCSSVVVERQSVLDNNENYLELLNKLGMTVEVLSKD